MVRHRSRNLTYRAALKLKKFGSYLEMEKLVALREALEELYASKYAEIVFNIDCCI
jgi:hypothetical protein